MEDVDETDESKGFVIPQAVVSNRPGDLVDRYKLLEKIGEGGFGVVYLAEQREPMKRRVALKIIKLGMDTEQVVARFEAERQALALLDHPNIAKVFDGGSTASGRPYFVMELVYGVPINAYCSKNRLGLEARLELFISTCVAIQHAHQKGIIHRDIKPSNILVALRDGAPVPMVIDFGVAKATQQNLTDRTLFTRSEQLIGTPAYMSPEQAERGGLDVDTRSDVYSLGVLLYELLTGSPPLGAETLKTASREEICRKICEEMPSRPSMKLKRASVQSGERSEPLHFKADLDWIVMKALQKDRTRRYETANAFAQDVRRYLEDRPVSAAAPSTWYFLRKSVRRHRGQFLAALLVLLSLTAGLLAAFWGLYQARIELREKEEGLETIRRRIQGGYSYQANTAYEQGEFLKAARMLEECDEEYRHWEWRRIAAINPFREAALETISNDVSPIIYGHAFDRDFKRIAFGHLGNAKFSMWDIDGGDEGKMIWQVSEKYSVGIERHFGRGSISPDGSMVAFGLYDGRVQVRNASNGELIDGQALLLRIDQPPAVSTMFSPDGKWLAVGGGSLSNEGGMGSIQIWDTGNWELEKTWIGGLEFPREASVLFSPDGKQLAIRGPSNQIFFWDLESDEPRLLGEHSDNEKTKVLSFAYSGDGRRLVSSGNDGCITLWDMAKHERLKAFPHAKILPLGREKGIRAVAIDSTGRRIASGGGNGIIRVWDSDTTELIQELKAKPWFIQYLTFTDDDSSILSCGIDGQILRWDAEPIPAARTFGYHNGPVDWIAFRPDGKRLASCGSQDGTVRVFEVSSGQEILGFAGLWSPDFVAFSESGETLIVASKGDRTVRVWDASDGELKRSDQQALERFRTGALGALGGLYAISAGNTNDFDSDIGAGLDAFLGDDYRTHALSPNGEQLAYCHRLEGGRFSVEVRDMAGGECEPTVLPDSDRACADLQFDSGSGRLLAAATSDGIYIWELDSPLSPPQILPAFTVGTITFSSDGERLASGDSDGSVRLWDVRSGVEVATLDAIEEGVTRGGMTISYDRPSRSIKCVRFSPDDRILAAARSDGAIRIWDSERPSENLLQSRKSVVEATAVVDEISRRFFDKRLMVERIRGNSSLVRDVRERALEILETRTRTRSENPRALINHCEHLLQMQEPSEKAEIQDYSQALGLLMEVQQEFPGRRSLQGKSSYRLGDYEAAIQLLDEPWKGRRFEDLAALALARFKLDAIADAKKILARAVELHARNGEHEEPLWLEEALTTIRAPQTSIKPSP